MDKESFVFEPKASFEAFPFFVLRNWEAEGQWQRGRLSFAVFSLAKQRKDSSCRATPDRRSNKLAENYISDESDEIIHIDKRRSSPVNATGLLPSQE